MSDETEIPKSLLPYDKWTETALREVVGEALGYVAQHGLPGEHHFYITFRTDHPDTEMPARLRAQYPHEITIVLQHQFWDLKMDPDTGLFSVGLSFGGTPAHLVASLDALTGFADPAVHYGISFHAVTDDGKKMPEVGADSPAPAEPEAEAKSDAAAEPATPQVVSLDAFRRRPTKP
jgi:uncharacterized protein